MSRTQPSSKDNRINHILIMYMSLIRCSSGPFKSRVDFQYASVLQFTFTGSKNTPSSAAVPKYSRSNAEIWLIFSKTKVSEVTCLELQSQCRFPLQPLSFWRPRSGWLCWWSSLAGRGPCRRRPAFAWQPSGG